MDIRQVCRRLNQLMYSDLCGVLTQHDPAESGTSFKGKTLVSRPGAPHDML